MQPSNLKPIDKASFFNWGLKSYWLKATLLSLVVSTAWMVFFHFKQTYPFLTFYPGLRDLISNLHSTIIFWHEGFRLYTEPTQNLVSPVSTETTSTLAAFWDWNPVEFFTAPYWLGQKPLMIIWPFVPRPYPPGIFISLSPITAAMSLSGGMSVWSYAATSWLFCFWGHMAVAAGWLLAKTYKSMVIKLILFALLYHELVGWSLSSQYDSYCLIFLFLAIFNLHAKNRPLAFLHFSVAAFIHFRILLWAPIPFLFLFEKDRFNWNQIKTEILQNKTIYLFGFALSAIAGLCFCLMYWKVKGAYAANPLKDMLLSNQWSHKAWLYTSTTIIYLGYLFLKKNWSWLLCLCWLTLVLLTMQFLQVWYCLFFLPVLFLGLNPRSGWTEFLPRFGYYLILCYCFLDYVPIGFVKATINLLVP